MPPVRRIQAPGDQHGSFIIFVIGARVQALAQLLAGLEEGNPLFLDEHAVAGARITAGTRRPVFHRKRAETTKFDPVSARQGICNLIENGIDDIFDITVIKMRDCEPQQSAPVLT